MALIGEFWLPSDTPETLARVGNHAFTPGYKLAAELVAEDGLDAVYTGTLGEGTAFDVDNEGKLKSVDHLVAQIKKEVAAFTTPNKNGHIAGLNGLVMAAEGHDEDRVVSRWFLLPDSPENQKFIDKNPTLISPDQRKQRYIELQHAYATLIGQLSLSLPGCQCLFQAQELGVPTANPADLHREFGHTAVEYRAGHWPSPESVETLEKMHATALASGKPEAKWITEILGWTQHNTDAIQGWEQGKINERRKWDPQDLAWVLGGFDLARSMVPWNKEMVKKNEGWVGMPEIYEHFTPYSRNHTLKAYKDAIALRKDSAALQEGDLRFIETNPPLPPCVLAFVRTDRNDRRLCVFNFSDEIAVTINLQDAFYDDGKGRKISLDNMRIDGRTSISVGVIEGKVATLTQPEQAVNTPFSSRPSAPTSGRGF